MIDIEYITKQGDTWDMIAKKVYGNEKRMDFLMQNNRKLLEYFIFPAGVILNVPELPEKLDADLPPWRTEA